MKNSFSNKFINKKFDSFKMNQLNKSRKKQQDSNVEKKRGKGRTGKSIIPQKVTK